MFIIVFIIEPEIAPATLLERSQETSNTEKVKKKTPPCSFSLICFPVNFKYLYAKTFLKDKRIQINLWSKPNGVNDVACFSSFAHCT